MSLRLFSLIAFAILPSLAHAGLTWEQTRLEHEAPLMEQAYHARFNFTNTSGQTIQIVDIQSTCGCTAAEMAKRSYAPGESGTVEATFTYGTRTGAQHKAVTVVTDDGNRHTLDIHVAIPVLANLSPRVVQWRQGSSPQTQTLELTINPEADVNVSMILCNDPQMQITTRPGENGVTYIDVTPLTTESARRSVIQVRLNYPQDQPLTFSALGWIRNS